MFELERPAVGRQIVKLLNRLGGRTRIADGGEKSEICKSSGKSEIERD